MYISSGAPLNDLDLGLDSLKCLLVGLCWPEAEHVSDLVAHIGPSKTP